MKNLHHTKLIITGGTLRGRSIAAPEWARPTSHKARQALMNRLYSLDSSLFNGYAADICAGSGALGLELLSRGAKHVSFVDLKLDAVMFNLKQLGVAPNSYTLHQLDARKLLPPTDTTFRLIVADPPYKTEPITLWVKAWMPWISEETTLCLEQEAEHVCLDIPGLELIQQATYGRACWTIWKRN